MSAVTLKTILTESLDGDWGSDEGSEDLRFRVVRGTDFDALSRGDASGVPTRFLSESSKSRRTLRIGDVLIETAGGSRDRPTGRTLLITQRVLDALGMQSTCASFARFLRPDPAQVDSAYLHYRLVSAYRAGVMDTYQVQHTGVARFQYTTFARSYEMGLPRLPAQRAIAEVLGALDDKIAANAQLAKATDDLCGAMFERFRGCGTTTLDRIASVNDRSVKPGNGELRYLDITSVSTGSYSWPEAMPWAQAPGRARRLVRRGDTVWSTVRPNRRSHALVLDEGLIGSTGLAVITSTTAGPAFVYQATKTPQFTAYLEAVAEGSAYPAVRAERFLQAPVPDAGPHDRERFESVAFPARLRANAAAVESRRLADLRDTLLPHLMSGRISVREAEKAVEVVL